jgi:hypothetical protein
MTDNCPSSHYYALVALLCPSDIYMLFYSKRGEKRLGMINGDLAVYLSSVTLSNPTYACGSVGEAVRMDHSYTSPMPTCDVVDCTNPATDTVPAPGVLGGQLYVCKSDMQKIASGTYMYIVKPEIQKLELRKKS